MYPFDLREKQIQIERGPVYQSSQWEAEQIGQIIDELVIIRGVILATRSRSAVLQEGYAYLDEDRNSARGIWLNETQFQVYEEPAAEIPDDSITELPPLNT